MDALRRTTAHPSAGGTPSRPRFALGHAYATPSALDAIQDAAAHAGQEPAHLLRQLLARPLAGDWGDLDAEDRAANAHALATGARILSAYVLPGGERCWIITDGADDDGVRHSTTAMRPEDY